MQAQLESFFAWCERTPCAWQPRAPLTNAFDALTERFRRSPPQSGDGAPVGVRDLYAATMSRMSSSSRWASLASALATAERGDGTAVRDLAHEYLGVEPNSTISADATAAINCLDHPVERDLDRYTELARNARNRARLSMVSEICPWADSGSARWWPTELPGRGR